MKPVPFEYVRPGSIAELCETLREDENARIIAGGQTLVPMLAMRLARPSKLVDVMRLAEMGGIRVYDDRLTIGANTIQAAMERSPLVTAHAPLLSIALPWVGHPHTRSRGTVGGSIANADPSAEIPLVAATLSAELIVSDGTDEMIFCPDEFFLGAMVTALPEASCIKAVRFPIWNEELVGVGFHEVSVRRSDFAFAAAAAQIALDSSGVCTRIALGISGLGENPVRLDVQCLRGSRLDPSQVQEATQEACKDLEAVSDLHASSQYRRRLAHASAVRAVSSAVANALRLGDVDEG